MGWFPSGLQSDQSGWRFDIVGLLAVVGSSAIQKHLQAITASPFAIFPRLLPAPETLLDTNRPKRPPSVKGVTMVGVHSGNIFHELNFFANIWQDVDEIEKYEFRVYNIRYNKADSERGTSSSQSQDDGGVSIKLQTFCWLNILTLVSILMTAGLFVWAGCIGDGAALVGLGTMSLSTSTASLSARWYPRLTARTAIAKVPRGDMIIKTSAGAFILVRGEEDVIRELYGNVGDCKYQYSGKRHHLLLAASTILLMASIIIFSNCGWVMQIAIGVAYIILNMLYWLLALLVKPKDIWDMSRYVLEEAPTAKDANKNARKGTKKGATPNYTNTLWQAINTTKTIDWVSKGGFAPSTEAWKMWLMEAKSNIGNNDWDAVKRKDELMRTNGSPSVEAARSRNTLCKNPGDEENILGNQFDPSC
ncbi:hypothetical protein ASPWEDRAFT_43967 [Aspergillus wentii DTO 134E9]|uniref:Uncharacterized protein n=1 Tax=Aspergillus wentii DTO 134E9 TaxID=1073089 RepID=A0A1L9RAK9_ASPWE|nr:uncharacterized protein ASPWEDRAFT_43967 [Aspergillus wentii DTO 134E9]KAI9934547.1 hypothetical protein MW887_000162 [Aspergillus wentii]OJJ31962.1 hypothetical protein ASPWEDRAFT_43967 [Aspergillus wentii DTO 134E9]